MSFANWEFPHTNYYNSDLRELIRMYKELTENYDSIKQMIEESVRDYNTLINDNSEIKQRMSRIESAMKELENRIKREVDQTVKDGMSSAVELIRKENSDMLNEFTQYVSDINNLIQNLRSYVSTSVSEMSNSIKRNTTLLKNYSDNGDAKLYKHIDDRCEEIEESIKSIKIDQTEIINPTNEKQQSVQDTVNSLFYNLKSWSLRAINFDIFGVTAKEYDDLDINAWSYDYLAKWYVKEKTLLLKEVNKVYNVIDSKITDMLKLLDNRTKAYSPISGLIISSKDLCYEICSLLRNQALEAIEYDLLDLTAEDYDNMGLSAYNFDWFGAMFFTNGNYSINATDYDKLELNALTYDMLGMQAIVYDLSAKRALYGI